MTTREGLMAAILAAPDDDLPRLVFADWLEENGEADRAEFIRVQVAIAKQPLAARCPECGEVEEFMMGTPDFPLEYGCPNDHFWGADRVEKLKERERELWQTACGPVICPTGIDGWRVEAAFDERGNVRPQLIRPGNHVTEEVIVTRGWVSEVRCTFAGWRGGVCRRCGGRGVESVYERGEYGPNRYQQTCPDCHRTGTKPGIGPTVVRSHPVKRVVLNGVVRPVEADPAFGMVYRQDIGPLWPFLCNHPRYSGNLISMGVAVTDVIEKLESAVSDCAIEWAKSVTPGESGVQQRTGELA